MNKKRFTIVEDRRFWDRITGTYVTIDYLVDLCNYLTNENEQLKSDLDYFKAKNGSLETGMFNLERENEQLKSENNMLKVTIGRNEGYIDRLTHKGEWR